MTLKRLGVGGLAAALGIVVGLLTSMAHAEDRSRTVNVYAWAEYFPPSVIDKFQRATGMHVNMTLFDSVNVAETTMSVGRSNFDVVTMNATPQLVREIPGGYWKKLDRSAIPNAANADPTLLKLLERADPGNQYAVPWMWGTVGVMYNVDKVKALIGSVPAQSLDMVFDKKYSEKLAKCGINILDSWGDILPIVAEYLGLPKLAADPASLKAISAKLAEIKPQLRRIATAGYYEQMADGELCVALGYSGDAMVGRRMVTEGKTGVSIAFTPPAGSVPVFIDSMVIPADSPNPAGAAAFINFMMQPDMSAEVVNFIGFAGGNAAALKLLPPAVRDNPIVYPEPAVRARFELEPAYPPEDVRKYTRLWQQFISGQ